jgi:hypothetical protein
MRESPCVVDVSLVDRVSAGAGNWRQVAGKLAGRAGDWCMARPACTNGILGTWLAGTAVVLGVSRKPPGNMEE